MRRVRGTMLGDHQNTMRDTKHTREVIVDRGERCTIIAPSGH